MKQVNLYIETDCAAFQKHIRTYGYVLEYITSSGTTVTRESYRKGSGTYHQETLLTLAEALGRIHEPCSVCVRGRDKFVLSMLTGKLKEWAGQDLTSNGKPITNREEWEALWEKIKIHEASTQTGKHPYSGWMLAEMEERCDKESKETKEHLTEPGQ